MPSTSKGRDDSKCDEDMAKLQTLRASVEEEELKAGEVRLESLRAEAAVPMPKPQVDHQNMEADVSRMQRVIDDATGVESVASGCPQSHGRRGRRWGGCRRQEKVAQVRHHQRWCPINTQLRARPRSTFRCRESGEQCGLRGCRFGEASNPCPEILHAGDTDTESLAKYDESTSEDGGRDGASAFAGDHPVPVEELVEQVPDLQLPHREAFTRGLHSFGAVDLETILRRRPIIIMRSVPTFLKGAFRRALVFAADEALEGLAALDERRQKRTWKLFMLLPRLLLHRPSRGGLVKKTLLRERFAKFASGWWDSLLEESVRGAGVRFGQTETQTRTGSGREEGCSCREVGSSWRALRSTASIGGRSCRTWHISHAGSSDALASGGRLLPFVLTFHGQPSVFFWEDETVEDIQQE